MPVDIRDPPSFSDLTRAVLGSAMTVDEVFALLGHQPGGPVTPNSGDGTSDREARLWVGSVGYERYRLNTDFAARLTEVGVQCLIDVRQLPISRRPGYSKSALAKALVAVGIEYVHMRALGNPKPTRDLYKSGRVAEGQTGYEQYLLGEQRGALSDLANLLEERRCALMCVEHDPAICHRTVIVGALRNELGLELDIAELG